METLRTVFNQCISMITTLWGYLLNSWGIFGAFVIGIPLLKYVARTFNKLKS